MSFLHKKDKRIIRACSNCGIPNKYCKTRANSANYFCNRNCYDIFKQQIKRQPHVCKTCQVVYDSINELEYCSIECGNNINTKNEYIPLISFESSSQLQRMYELDASKAIIKKWDRCSWQVAYTDNNGQQCTYKPDFDILYHDGRRVIEDVRRFLTETDELRKKAVEALCFQEGCEYRLNINVENFDWNVPTINEEYVNSYGVFGRPSMTTVIMMMAKEISKRSTCLRNKVGAVVCNQEHTQIYSVGHNGDEPGGANECDSLKTGACGCLHAESTALMKANRDLTGCVLYATVAPCIMCSKSIIMAKIKKVVYLRKYRNENGLNLLRKHNIEVYHYNDIVNNSSRIQYGFVSNCECCD